MVRVFIRGTQQVGGTASWVGQLRPCKEELQNEVTQNPWDLFFLMSL